MENKTKDIQNNLHAIFVINRNLNRINWQRVLKKTSKKILIICPKSESHQTIEIKRYSEYVCFYFLESSEYDLINILTNKYFNLVSRFTKIVCNHELDILECAKARDYFNLEGMRVTEAMSYLDKDLMKKKVSRDVYPPYLVVKEGVRKKDIILFSHSAGFPLFVKPLNGSGSVGTKKIDDEKSLEKWINQLRSTDVFEIDKFITGDVYHYDFFMFNQNLIYGVVSKYICPPYLFFNGFNSGSISLPDNTRESKEITLFAKKIITLLQPVFDGSFHLEVIKSNKGGFYFIEIAARAGGCNIWRMHNKTNVFDFYTAPYEMILTDKFTINSFSGLYSANLWVPVNYGVLDKAKIPKYKNISVEIIWRDENIEHKKPLSIGDRILEATFSSNSFSELEQEFMKLKCFTPYDNKI